MTEIAHNLDLINEKLCQLEAYNSQVKLIAVSKTKPVSMVLEAINAGHTLFGENKVQEARDKKKKLPDEIDLHLIGPLQSNKIKYCPSIFSTIHSTTSLSTITELNRRYKEHSKIVKILIQLNLCKETSKSGLIEENDLSQILDQSSEFKNVQITGLMTIPDPNLSSIEVAKVFNRLRQIRDSYSVQYGIKDTFKELSMGMSSDYQIAVKEGATFIRLGSVIFGDRNHS